MTRRSELFPAWLYVVVIALLVLMMFVECADERDCHAHGGAYISGAFSMECVSAVKP